MLLMKSISLYTDNKLWMTGLHPFTNLFYLFSAILIPVISSHLITYILTVEAGQRSTHIPGTGHWLQNSGGACEAGGLCFPESR